VIKSYTEEDVHKSLKHEIWASTDLGNKRLDRAFRESAEKGPIYLFFSVNARFVPSPSFLFFADDLALSGHFAGMAQMLTPVDYATSSTVWASDKWKGVLKLKWIYIKDVPLASLRHIRLSCVPSLSPPCSLLIHRLQEHSGEQTCVRLDLSLPMTLTDDSMSTARPLAIHKRFRTRQDARCSVF
jgi:hypothetical protein